MNGAAQEMLKKYRPLTLIFAELLLFNSFFADFSFAFSSPAQLLRPRSARTAPSFIDPFVSTPNIARDGGSQRAAIPWVEILGKVEALSRYLQSREPKDVARIGRELEALQNDLKDKPAIASLIQSILAYLSHNQEVAPHMKGALVAVERRVTVELLPKIQRFAKASRDGGGRTKTLGEVFDEKTDAGPVYLKNPFDVKAATARGIAAIVLNAGEGKRMRPDLKQTFSFLEKPMGVWPILALQEKEIPTVVVVGHEKEKVVAAFEKEVQGVTYIEQKAPFNGTADAVLAGLKALEGYDGPVLVINGDAAAIDGDFVQWLEAALSRTSKEAVVVIDEVPDPQGMGRVVSSLTGSSVAVVEQTEIDQGGRRIHGREVGSSELQRIQFVNAGFYGFKHADQLRQSLRGLLPFRTDPNVEYGVVGVFEGGIAAQVVTVPKGAEYQLIQPNDPASARELEEEVRRRRSTSTEWERRSNLVDQLHRQGVQIWGDIFSGQIYIGPHVDISEFKGGVLENGTEISGHSKIGARAHLSGKIRDSIVGEDVKITRGVEINNTTIGRKSKFAGASVSNYDLEEGVLVEDSTLSMEGESSFGNGVRVLVGIEKEGGRDLLISDTLTFDEAKRIVMDRSDSERLEAYRRRAMEYAASQRSPKGRVEEGAQISQTPVLVNVRIGAHAIVYNAVELRNVTVLSDAEHPTKINSHAIVTDAVIHKGIYVGERATVKESILFPYSGAKDNVVIEHSVVGSHSVMRFGHVIASFIGPFVGKNHPSILIGVLWPGGRGNVGGQHTGSNHSSRGPTEEAFYPALAFLGTNTDMFYPFSATTGIIVGGGLNVLPSQRIEFPFSLLTSPSVSPDDPRFNEIMPGWGLYGTPYYYARAEYHHARLNKEKGTDLDTRIFTPEVAEEMVKALALLQETPRSGKPALGNAVYTEKDYPGIGKNIMTERSRQRGIETYQFYISYYALGALKGRLLEIFKSDTTTWRAVQENLMEEVGGEEWGYARDLLEKVTGKKVTDWDRDFVSGLLGELESSETKHLGAVLHSKEKDRERGVGIFEDYEAVHDSIEVLPVVVELRRRFRETSVEIGGLQRSLSALHDSAGGASAARDGGIRAGAVQELEKYIGEDFLPYAPGRGIEPIRNAIHDYELNLYGRNYAPAQMIVTAGTKVPLENLLLSLLEPTDTPDRVWSSGRSPGEYDRIIQNVTAEGAPGYLPRFGTIDLLVVHLRSKKDPFPKAILLKLSDRERKDPALKVKLRRIFNFASAYTAAVILDETYASVLDEGEENVVEAVVAEAPSYAKYLVTLVEISRRYSDLEGWKVGYLLSRNTDLLNTFANVTSQTNTSVNIANQKALVAPLQRAAQTHAPREVPSITSVVGAPFLISERGSSVKPSPTVAMAAKAAKEPEALRFDIGQSGFGPSEEMKKAMMEVARGDFSTETVEAFSLEAHSHYLGWTRGLEAAAVNTVVGFGAKPLLFNTLRAKAALAARQRKKMVVAVPEPYWVSYPELATLAGGVDLIIETSPGNNFNVTTQQLDAAFSGYQERHQGEAIQKVFVLNSPNNPSGQMSTRDELVALARWAVANDVLVISDEIYGDLALEDIPHVSIASLEDEVPGIRQRTIVFTGIAKEVAAPGLRVGFATGWDMELISEIRRFTVDGPDKIALAASWGAYRNREAYEAHTAAHRDWLRERKHQLEAALRDAGISHLRSYGGIYLMPDMRPFFGAFLGAQLITAENAFEIPEGPFFRGTKIVGIPGESFGKSDHWAGHWRLSYPVRKMETLNQAAEALRQFPEKVVVSDDGGKRAAPIIPRHFHAQRLVESGV